MLKHRIKKQGSRKKFYHGLTLLEMVISLSIIIVIMAIMAPQLNTINKSWASKQGSSEALQNGRILVEHINRNLAKAVRIIDVSDSGVNLGYIEFEDNNGDTQRYQVSGSLVQYGQPGSLFDLAGPVTKFQLTCYDDNDLDTPVDIAADGADGIRFVKAGVTLTNSAALGQDKDFVASAYIRSSSTANLPPVNAEPASPFEFNVVMGITPNLCEIDDDHFLCAYTGPGTDGWAVVATVNRLDWSLTREVTFEFDNSKATLPDLIKIDDTHYLCAYESKFSDGTALVLTVDTVTDTVSGGTPFVFEPDQAASLALAKIDDEHYLCAYTGMNTDGWAVVLTVDTGLWTVTKETPYEFESNQAVTPTLAKIDDEHYLCAYSGFADDGMITVLTVDDSTWDIFKSTTLEFDPIDGEAPVLARIDNDRFLCVYEGMLTHGRANIMTVDTDSWLVTAANTALEYDTARGQSPTVLEINNSDGRYLCVYQGQNNDGWGVILKEGPPLLP